MQEPAFELNADVMPITGGRGRVLDIRWINDAEWIYGVVTTNGKIDYYQERSLRDASRML